MKLLEWIVSLFKKPKEELELKFGETTEDGVKIKVVPKVKPDPEKNKELKKKHKGLKHSNPSVKKGDYQFSMKSLNNLKGIDKDLVFICHWVLKRSSYDIGIIEGLRSAERQQELIDSGASKVKRSKHQDGLAIDFLVWVNGEPEWDNLEPYYHVIDWFNKAFKWYEVKGRTGLCWSQIGLDEFNARRCLEGYTGSFVDAYHIERSNG